MIGGVGGFSGKQFGQPLFLNMVTHKKEIATNDSFNSSILSMPNEPSADRVKKLLRVNSN